MLFCILPSLFLSLSLSLYICIYIHINISHGNHTYTHIDQEISWLTPQRHRQAIHTRTSWWWWWWQQAAVCTRKWKDDCYRHSFSSLRVRVSPTLRSPYMHTLGLPFRSFSSLLRSFHCARLFIAVLQRFLARLQRRRKMTKYFFWFTSWMTTTELFGLHFSIFQLFRYCLRLLLALAWHKMYYYGTWKNIYILL